jgi:hypothetical protein
VAPTLTPTVVVVQTELPGKPLQPRVIQAPSTPTPVVSALPGSGDGSGGGISFVQQLGLALIVVSLVMLLAYAAVTARKR